MEITNEIYHKYKNYVRSLVLSKFRFDTDEICQEFWVHIIEKSSNYNPQYAFTTFIKNLWQFFYMDYSRKNKKQGFKIASRYVFDPIKGIRHKWEPLTNWRVPIYFTNAHFEIPNRPDINRVLPKQNKEYLTAKKMLRGETYGNSTTRKRIREKMKNDPIFMRELQNFCESINGN